MKKPSTLLFAHALTRSKPEPLGKHYYAKPSSIKHSTERSELQSMLASMREKLHNLQPHLASDRHGMLIARLEKAEKKIEKM